MCWTFDFCFVFQNLHSFLYVFMFNHLRKYKTKCDLLYWKGNLHKRWIRTFWNRKINLAYLKLDCLIFLWIRFSINELKVASSDIRIYTKEKCTLWSFLCFILLKCSLYKFLKFIKLFFIKLSICTTEPTSFFLFKLLLSDLSYDFFHWIDRKLHKFLHLNVIKDIANYIFIFCLKDLKIRALFCVLMLWLNDNVHIIDKLLFKFL